MKEQAWHCRTGIGFVLCWSWVCSREQDGGGRRNLKFIWHKGSGHFLKLLDERCLLNLPTLFCFCYFHLYFDSCWVCTSLTYCRYNQGQGQACPSFFSLLAMPIRIRLLVWYDHEILLEVNTNGFLERNLMLLIHVSLGDVHFPPCRKGVILE